MTFNHVVMFSGGIGSWMTAKIVIDQYGPDHVTLLFADVKGDNKVPELGEDEDCYRFISESAWMLGARLVTVSDGRDVWQVFKDKRWISNSRVAHCSQYLKQIPARKWLEDNCNPEETFVYVGIDWTESHRLPKIRKAYEPFSAVAPLTRPPYYSKDEMLDAARAFGIEPPRMYEDGYPHANCQGACVKAGAGQWKQVLLNSPRVFAYHERKEQELRDELGRNDISILRTAGYGERIPMTLRELRSRVANDLGVDDDDVGGCGCFTDTEDES